MSLWEASSSKPKTSNKKVMIRRWVVMVLTVQILLFIERLSDFEASKLVLIETGGGCACSTGHLCDWSYDFAGIEACSSSSSSGECM